MFRRDNHKMVFTGIRRGDLYIVDFTKKALEWPPCGHDVLHGMPSSNLFTCLTSTAKSILIKYDIINSKDMISFNKLVKVSHAHLGKVAISHDSSIQNVMLVESLGYNLLSDFNISRNDIANDSNISFGTRKISKLK